MTSQGGGNALALVKEMIALLADRRTGVLDLRADGVGTRIYFEDGKPVFAEDEALGETFGRLLVRQGVLTNEQFIRVLDEMTLAANGDNQLRFGEVAVGQGVLTHEQVERGLADQVCGIITRSLQREESRWVFDSSPSAAKPPRSFSLEVDPIVLRAMRRLPEPAADAAPRPDPPSRDEAAGAVAEVAREESKKRDFPGPDGSTHAARIAAEQAFQKGTALLRATQSASAAIELRRASKLQPESLEYLLYATWAEARGRREIPAESDQRSLLEIAQRLKRRDPLCAFGSYVLGQLAMWAGDDAAAKKWFYEALRLDPTSEAGQQVRVLARRGTGTVAPPTMDEPSYRDATTESAPLPAREPVQAPTAIEPSRPPSARWTRRLVPGAAVLATAAVVSLGVARKSAPSAARAPASSPAPALSTGSVLPVDPEPKDTSAPRDVRRAGPPASGPVPQREDGEWGTVRLPAHAAGHRIFMDGRRIKADGIAPLHLPCGPHVIQIGSRGKPQSVELPCRGEVQLQ